MNGLVNFFSRKNVGLGTIKSVSVDDLDFAENIFNTVREPLLLLDKELQVVKASHSFFEYFRVSPAETIGKLVYDLGNGQWNIPELRDLLETILPEKNTFDNFEVRHQFLQLGKRVMLLNARQIYRAKGKEKIILLAIEDITERKLKEESSSEINRMNIAYLDILFNHAHVPIVIWDSEFLITRYNRAFEELLGFDLNELTGKKLDVLFPKDKTELSLDLLRKALSKEVSELIELDIITRGDNVKTVLWNSANILDENGKNVIATIAQDITRRKKNEDSIVTLETRYRRLFETAQDGILILDAETGMIIDVNPFLIDLLGYSKSDFVEKEIWQIGLFKDIAANKDKFSELQEKNYVRYENLPLETADGRKINVEFVSNVYLVNTKKVIQCNIRDITERKKAEKALISSENSLKTLVQTIPDIIWLKDINGIYLSCNQMCERFFGAAEAEIIGKSDYDFVDRELADTLRLHDRNAIEAGKPTRNEEWITFADDGHHAYLETIKAPMFDDQKKLIGILGIGRDITERNLVAAELVKAKEKAEESDRLKSSFLANMSHEIRTPMNGVLGFTELLKEPKLSGAEQQAYIKIIEKSGVRLLNIINDIIKISKADSGNAEILISDTDISEQIEYIYNFFKPLAEEKKLMISFKSPFSGIDAIVRTDREKVYAVLTNLVNNAIKFTQSGRVEFGVKKIDGYLEFFVKDTGIGIPYSQRDLIFERFRQGSESLTRNYEGSGLGLAISKAYVEMLGGRIWVDSDSKGSTFYFTIPYDPVNVSDEVRSKDNIDEKGGSKISGLKILIVEDDEASRKLIQLTVTPFAGEVLIADNGNDAVKLCRSNADIDLVLMDLKLPELNGYDATKQIRSFNSGVVIIAQTAYGLEGDKMKAIDAGCTDYISKPVSKSALFKLIDKYFKKFSRSKMPVL